MYGLANAVSSDYKTVISLTSREWKIDSLGNNPTPIYLPVALRIGQELDLFELSHVFSQPWKVFLGNRDNREFMSFQDAFKAMLDWVNEQPKKGGLATQILETGIWIEEGATSLPVFFYDAKEIACEMCWLINGEWKI